VIEARAAAGRRWAGHGYRVNAQVPGRVLRSPPFRLPASCTEVLVKRMDRGSLSARGYDRILRVAWTIVDIDGRTCPTKADVDEAAELRNGA
jgi:magnesium chelatase family protein